jgi:tetratricopeptide (TPR) repeat protein
MRSYDDIKPNSLIQTTAPISPGSSGGGLFNAKGELIGITTQQIKEGQSLNFALSASLLEDFSERAAVYEKQREASKEFITQALIAEIIAETSMKWEPLLSISEKWLKIDPYNYMAWSSYGTALDGVKRYRDAIDAFNKSLSFVSTAAAYTGLAAAYISMGLEINESGSDLIHYDTENIVKAEQYLKSALQADPQYSDAWFWLGYIHYNKRNLGRAERYLKKSLKYSENTRTLRMLSHVNEDKGDQEKALSLLRRATEIAPDSIVDWLSFGRLAIELNRDDDVFRAYKNIRRLDKKVAERFLGSTSQ